MPIFYDTHAHLDYPEFAAELPHVIERAHAAGITKIISIGTDLESSRRAVEIAGQFPGVFAAIGWHPNEAASAPDDVRPALRELGRHPKVVALGETGLDYYRLPANDSAACETIKHKQARVFAQHLEVAVELGFNCVIHQRAAFEETLAQLAPFSGRVNTVFHCFTEPVESLRRVLATGAFVSFTGILSFKNAQTVRDSLAATPADRFMLETDCPFLAPMPYRGKRCEPAYVRETSVVAADVRGCSLDELSALTCETAHRFFPRLIQA